MLQLDGCHIKRVEGASVHALATPLIAWSLPALRLLLEVLGPERLARTAADRDAVRWGNAARLFALDPARTAPART